MENACGMIYGRKINYSTQKVPELHAFHDAKRSMQLNRERKKKTLHVHVGKKFWGIKIFSSLKNFVIFQIFFSKRIKKVFIGRYW